MGVVPKTRPRTASRVAAVQALFQSEQAGDSGDTVIDQFVRHRLGTLPGSDGFEDGRIRLYSKKAKIPQMHHIDYGLGLFRPAAFAACPRDAVVDLAAVQTDLVAREQLAGYELKERFYEIGSHAGLNELDRLLLNANARG